MTHEIGDVITLPDAANLPLGTKMAADNGYTYVLTEDGVFYEYGERLQLFNFEENSRFTLQSLGAGDPVVPQTVEQFKDKFCTLAIGAGRQSAVSGVAEALEELGIDYRTVLLRPGMFVHRYDVDRLRQIPDGTVLTWGLTTETRHMRALLSVVSGNGVQDLWTNHSGPSMMQVLEFPDGTEVTDWRPAREDEAVRLTLFRAKAAAVGRKAKERNSWCGVAEATMGKVFLGATDALLGYSNTGGVWVPREQVDGMTPAEEFAQASQWTTWVMANGVLLRKIRDDVFVHLNPVAVGERRFHVPVTSEMTADVHRAILAQIANSRMVWLPMMEPSNATEVTEADAWMAPTGSRAVSADGLDLVKREDGTWHNAMHGTRVPSQWVKYLPFNSPEHRVQGALAAIIGDEPSHVVVQVNGYHYRSLGNGHWMNANQQDRFRPNDLGTSPTWTVGHHSDWSYPTTWRGVTPARDSVATVDAMNRAPIGTMIEEQSVGDRWTCDHYEDGISMWVHHNAYGHEGFSPAEEFDLTGMTWLRTSAFRRDRAPREHRQFYYPVGTVLRNPANEAWMVRQENGTWVNPTYRRTILDAAQFDSLYESGIQEILNVGCNP